MAEINYDKYIANILDEIDPADQLIWQILFARWIYVTIALNYIFENMTIVILFIIVQYAIGFKNNFVSSKHIFRLIYCSGI